MLGNAIIHRAVALQEELRQIEGVREGLLVRTGAVLSNNCGKA